MKMPALALLFTMPAFSAVAAPKYGPLATPLSAKSNLEYFQKTPAADYWALSPYYVPQETGRGCSAANLAMVLNAARVGMPLTSADELVTFKSFCEKYADATYRDAIFGKLSPIGENFSNKNLTRLLGEAAAKLKLTGARAEHQLATTKEKFVEALAKNEKSANDFIVFSFIQGRLTGDPEGGAHVATIAGYDAKKGLVLVMDPDRQWYEPYWTPASDLFEAIRDPKSDSRKEAGWIVFQAR